LMADIIFPHWLWNGWQMINNTIKVFPSLQGVKRCSFD
jgi:hypothetical protein